MHDDHHSDDAAAQQYPPGNDDVDADDDDDSSSQHHTKTMSFQLGFSEEYQDGDNEHKMMVGHRSFRWKDWDGGQIGGRRELKSVLMR